jgi:uncharacterized protein (TIGR02246 family)
MRTLILTLAALACLQAADDSAGVKDLVRRYQDARENRDPKAIAVLFTGNADQLVSNGEWRRGREALTKGMLASSEQNSGKRTLTVETVRFLTPDIAIADARYEIGGRPPMWSTFVARRQNGTWRIEAIRNMAPNRPAAAGAPSK